MVTQMNDRDIQSLEQIRCFLQGTESVEFQVQGKDERYAWTEHTLRRFHYRTLGKAERGLVRRFIERISGLSRAQVTRLVGQYRRCGRVRRAQRTTHPFRTRYTDTDVRALAELDERHATLSGPATKKLCERAFELFGDLRYQRLATISVAHLYNLRKRTAYTRRRRHFAKTRPTQVAIGQRRKPQPDGQPGFIRVDTVHQGDFDRIKGVYHINAVDEITQFQLVLSVEKISERYLLPILEELLERFPFIVQSFHADNGSEFINHTVAKLLNKLLIELTKSRPRHSNDNALAETKNGAIIRKHLGYQHIAQKWAPRLNAFHREHFHPYINFHRPCFFPVIETDDKGKQQRRYPYTAMMTPYDKLKSLPNPERYLKPGITFAQLDALAYQISDNEAADKLQNAKRELFQTIFEQRTRAA
jgi:transposase InsO family protein